MPGIPRSVIIRTARSHLAGDNPGAYRRIMEGAIRMASTKALAAQLQQTMDADLRSHDQKAAA